MAGAIEKAWKAMKKDIARTSNTRKKVLQPNPTEGAGTRIFPARNAKNDAKYGLRIDKAEPVAGKENVVKVKLQININAESKTLRELARKNPHKVIATAEIDTTQEANEENLDKLEEAFNKTLNV